MMSCMNKIKVFSIAHFIVGLSSIIYLLGCIFAPVFFWLSIPKIQLELLIFTVPVIIVFSGLYFLVENYDNRRIKIQYRISIFIISGLNFILFLMCTLIIWNI